jgi:integrase
MGKEIITFQKRRKLSITFGKFMEEHYLPWAKQNKKRARDEISLYRNWIQSELAQKPMSEIGPLDVEKIKQNLQKAERSQRTIEYALAIVRLCFNKAALWNLWQGENPTKSVKFPRPNNVRQRFLTKDEAEILLAALKETSAQIYRMAIFALFGGLRLGEIFSLTWSNVNMTQGIINVLDTKTSDPRHVFITTPIQKILNDMTPSLPEEPLFPTKKNEPVKWLSKSFRAVVDRLDLNKGITDRRQRVTFHTLRHTYCSWAVMAGIPLYVVSKAVGHKTTIMTQRYSHLAPESQKQAFEAVARVL